MTEIIDLAPAAARSDRSAKGVDIALLASALFLQRFSLPWGNTFLSLEIVVAAFILLYQFFSGKLLIQYDRLFWFLATGIAVTCSLVLNFSSTMLNSYGLFLVLYLLVTMNRPSTPDRYMSTLQVFQFLVLVVSCLGVAQFILQFVLDVRKLIMFYGMIPDFLLSNGRAATINPVPGTSLVRTNGIFIAEASTFSQITALGILIEVLEFRRSRYLLAMALGFLLSYSGTGLLILSIFLPLASLRHNKVVLSVLLVVIFAIVLFVTGTIDQSAFLSRTNEFEYEGSSGYGRFVDPFRLMAKYLDSASLGELLIGNGPGTAKIYGTFNTLFKLWYEYGILGTFTFVCFSACCLKKSRCSGLVLAALIFICIFEGGYLTGWLLIMIIVLCTLHGPEPRSAAVGGQRAYTLAMPTPQNVSIYWQ